MNNPQPPGFLAVPATGTGLGVLVLHAWWGLNDTIRAFCTRLSEAGYVALAPNLYHGKIATTIPEAENLSESLDPARARIDIKSAMATLIDLTVDGGWSMGVIGFSMGAYFALDLAFREPDSIRAVVLYYGTGSHNFGSAQYLGHFAENDPYEPDENINLLVSASRVAGRSLTVYRYPGTGHWFAEPDRTDAYRPEAAALAWQRTLDFLAATLTVE